MQRYKTNEIEELKTFEDFANESKLSAHKVEIRAGCRLLRFSADNLWNLFKFYTYEEYIHTPCSNKERKNTDEKSELSF